MLHDLLSALPYKWRNEIDGYLTTIKNASPDIFSEAGVKFDKAILDRFIVIVGIKRIWTMVDTNFWILDNSLSLMQENDISAIKIGGDTHSTNSDSYVEIRELRNQLNMLLSELQLGEYIDSNLKDILLMLKDEPINHGS